MIWTNQRAGKRNDDVDARILESDDDDHDDNGDDDMDDLVGFCVQMKERKYQREGEIDI